MDLFVVVFFRCLRSKTTLQHQHIREDTRREKPCMQMNIEELLLKTALTASAWKEMIQLQFSIKSGQPEFCERSL